MTSSHGVVALGVDLLRPTIRLVRQGALLALAATACAREPDRMRAMFRGNAAHAGVAAVRLD
ncbi:MAG: hypothetical protein H7066_20965, partial [Cytophagaceae bacterium]|nr:hypothetical protein [Gemmatimonadaceae bacterium]